MFRVEPRRDQHELADLHQWMLGKPPDEKPAPAAVAHQDHRLVIEMPLEFRPPAIVIDQVRVHDLGRLHIVALDEQLLLQPGNPVTV